VAFKEDHVGYLSTAKWFITEISDKTVLSGVTTFQGSDDDSTWTDLFTFDDNVHEGWNYYNWEDDEQPAYRYYRFYGTEDGSC